MRNSAFRWIRNRELCIKAATIWCPFHVLEHFPFLSEIIGARCRRIMAIILFVTIISTGLEDRKRRTVEPRSLLIAELSAHRSWVSGERYRLMLSGTLALSDDASDCLLLAREVRDRCAGMVIGIGNVDAMVRINRDLEKVSETAIRAAR